MTEEEYERAMRRIEQIFMAELGTTEGGELFRLCKQVEEYENKHCPLIQWEGVSLCPITSKGEILLYDIYVAQLDADGVMRDKWFGARRTIGACETYLGTRFYAGV